MAAANQDGRVIQGRVQQVDWEGLGRYGVIVMDQTWPGMTLDTDKGVPVASLAAPDCILFQVLTQDILGQIDHFGDRWGFEYVTVYPWIKARPEDLPGLKEGQLLPCDEHFVVSRRGRARRPEPDLTLFHLPVEHNYKPPAFYQLAETWPGPYLELFGRCARPGWTVYSFDVDS